MFNFNLKLSKILQLIIVALLYFNASNTYVSAEDSSYFPYFENPYVNSPPTFYYPYIYEEFLTFVGWTLSIPVKVIDPDGDSMTLSVQGVSGALYAYVPDSEIDTTIYWTPTRSDVGIHSIQVIANDGNGGIAINPISVSVSPNTIWFLEPIQLYWTINLWDILNLDVIAQCTDPNVNGISLSINPGDIPLTAYQFIPHETGNPVHYFFTVTNDIIPEGTHHVTFTASAGEYQTSTTLTIETRSFTAFFHDFDNDGIENSVDVQYMYFSNEFSDRPQGGYTQGTIDRGDQIIKIYDAPEPDPNRHRFGVIIEASPDGGTTPCKVIQAWTGQVFYLNPGDRIQIDPGSVVITALTGTIRGILRLDVGVNATFTLTKGNRLQYDFKTNNIMAPASNFECVDIGLNGENIGLKPGKFYIYTPDDIISSAPELTKGITFLSYLEYRGDWGWYRFQASKGKFMIQTFGKTDTHLTLYDPDGVTKLAEDEDSGVDFNAQIEWNCTNENVYYIRVDGFNHDVAGKYEILLSDATSGSPFYRYVSCASLIKNVSITLAPNKWETTFIRINFTDSYNYPPFQQSKLLSATIDSKPIPIKYIVNDALNKSIKVGDIVTITKPVELILIYNVTIWKMEYNIDQKKVGSYDVNSETYRLYTKTDYGLELDNEQIIETAKLITSNRTNPYVNAENIMKWVFKNIKYDLGGDFSALRTLQTRIGVCDDKCRLFVALCRVSGIPCRKVGGMAFKSDIQLEGIMVGGGHAWAEVYIPNFGWIFADPTWNMYADNDLLHSREMTGMNTAEMLPPDQIFYTLQTNANMTNVSNTYKTIPIDTDNDGVTNDEEIKHDTNALIKDTDGDGLSDWEEIFKYKSNPLKWDSDGDKLNDEEELSKYKTNPVNWDTDSDGLKDNEELRIGTNPIRRDTDDDGVIDWQEIYRYNTNPFREDSDEDGYDDLQEIKQETNPLVPSAFLKIVICDMYGNQLPSARVRWINGTDKQRELLYFNRGSNGTIFFSVNVGRYAFEASMYGYNNSTATILLTPGKVNNLKIALEKISSTQIIQRGITNLGKEMGKTLSAIPSYLIIFISAGILISLLILGLHKKNKHIKMVKPP